MPSVMHAPLLDSSQCALPERMAHMAVPDTGGAGFFSIEDLHVAIVDKAKLALSIIIGNNQFNDSFRATTATPTPVADAAAVSADDAALAKPPPPTNPTVANSCASGDPGSFKQHVHDLFMQAFAREMSDACGVRVIDT